MYHIQTYCGKPGFSKLSHSLCVSIHGTYNLLALVARLVRQYTLSVCMLSAFQMVLAGPGTQRGDLDMGARRDHHGGRG
jgi:hypothetical protein